ncbi:MAG TPA: helix-turn-helix domain-containing protein [Crenalkalicoccus sp.]|jgi:AraC family ethanolamine operon transcriptional activator|nr:helix-turn-helix domain-containing protein [Crenalkalicoccus sp.]
MTNLGSGGQASIVSRRFASAEEFAGAICDAGVDHVPLQVGPYDARLTVLRLGPMTLQRAEDRAHVARGAVHPGRAVLLMPLRHCEPAVVNGRLVREADMLLLAPGRELHCLCPAPMDWASLALPAAEAELLLELGRMPRMDSPAEPMRLVPPEAADTLRRVVAAAATLAEDLPGAVDRPGLVEALSDGLRELVTEAFSRAERPTPLHRRTQNEIRLVSTAEEFLRAHVARPIYTEELCRALGVSPRKLHHTFVAACGKSPQAYLKLRRLMLVHRALSAAGPEALLVKSVALAHGFWHLGNFARNYREQFGESPCETLARARAGGGDQRPHRLAAAADRAARSG